MKIVHPLLQEFLRIAYGCMACDGEIDASEVSCLRSIAIQMGQPVRQVDADLRTVREEFAEDAHRMVDRAKGRLLSVKMSEPDSELFLDILIQLVEADGVVHINEIRYVRDLVYEFKMDHQALKERHPEWQPYLAEGIRASARSEWPFADAAASSPDIRLDLNRNDPQ
ncbi:MAG: TerB family tellurite resistance protein [Bacteroidota bacterium]|nr:TerB family tellurite resistance protein [Bacteroidota bacterium]